MMMTSTSIQVSIPRARIFEPAEKGPKKGF